MITVRQIRPEEFKEMYDLRWRLNRKLFGLPKGSEMSEKDKNSYIAIAFNNDDSKIVGSARLESEEDIGKVEAVGVIELLQGQGIGRLIMDHLEGQAIKVGIKKLILSARKDAEIFYNKLGYISLNEHYCGEPYNIVEVNMEKSLNKILT